MKQPVFYPGKKLCADDLINLEEYAFSRTNILSPDHGVVSLFNNGLKTESAIDNRQPYFIISQVTGITPSGRPINFKADGKRFKLKLPYHVDHDSALVWDIYINDLHPINSDAVNEDEEKYSLSYVNVNEESQLPQLDSNKLYLGRYKLTRESKPEIISAPFLYSLSSFNFPTAQWQEWTFPIREALRKVAQTNTNDNISYFIKDIIYNYPFLSLSVLLRRCMQLTWLCQDKDLNTLLDEGVMFELQQNLVVDPLPEAMGKIHPQDIPKVIAEILMHGGVPNTWELFPPGMYELIPKQAPKDLIINRRFKGKHEIKFRFKDNIQSVERLVVDNFYSFDVEPFEEQDNNNRTCYSYVIPYPGSINEENFRLSIPDSWKNYDFSVYYRTMYEN